MSVGRKIGQMVHMHVHDADAPEVAHKEAKISLDFKARKIWCFWRSRIFDAYAPGACWINSTEKYRNAVALKHPRHVLHVALRSTAPGMGHKKNSAPSRPTRESGFIERLSV
jgi:hypothetical protein